MRFAASIRYGGQLIDASNATYNDYKNLGLICPECKSPVFLKRGEKVQSHFSHFRASTEAALIKECELRVEKYDSQEIEKRIAIARNQRLKFLQRWFWTIFKKHAFYGNVAKEIESKNILELMKIEAPVSQFVNAFLERVDGQDVTKAIANSIFAAAEGELKSAKVKAARKLVARCEKELHTLICCEVVNFLKSRMNRSLLSDAMASSFVIVKLSDRAQARMELEPWVPLTNLVIMLCLIPWAVEFEELSTK